MAQGNDPHAYSRVADCQGIQQVFLGVYDLPGGYKLSPENAGLQDTIDWFRGSFNRDGQATMGGFNARSVLQPEFADPATCQAGESPIECEYRVHRPSIVLISLEFGYDGRTTANYEAYLRQVIEFYIGKGVLPILATKADNKEGDNSINAAIARIAADYDIPLWNFWAATYPLTGHALLEDGFHLTNGPNYFDDPKSMDLGWPVRNLTALQSIDAVWQAVSK